MVISLIITNFLLKPVMKCLSFVWNLCAKEKKFKAISGKEDNPYYTVKY